ncbi:hypothetical protein Y1Q_0007249 [Alligator mississippiensis]|uniref:Uncharacterized protein n=1 Tax=Alligator mississippiensis TaxID=8496 RepID=A0A151NN39_ALLMI|nr:hypothetical protein Y1Q_0007249 [Alligator mississippiensis]
MHHRMHWGSWLYAKGNRRGRHGGDSAARAGCQVYQNKTRDHDRTQAVRIRTAYGERGQLSQETLLRKMTPS